MQLDRLRPSFFGTAALIAVVLLAAACSDNSDADSEDPPHIRGTITDIAIGSGDVLGSARIEGVIEADTQYDAAVVRIEDDTDIFRTVNGDLIEATFDDLTLGQQVESWFTGPVAESYPVQVKADRIVILEDATAT